MQKKLSCFRYFTGLDGKGNPVWKGDYFSAATVPARFVSYNAGLGRFIGVDTPVVAPDYITHLGRLSVYDAPHPWGPWSQVQVNTSFLGSMTTKDKFLYTRLGGFHAKRLRDLGARIPVVSRIGT